MDADRRDRLHVLMTADTVGGVWHYAIELAHALARHGDTVSLATMGSAPSAEQKRQAAEVPGLTLYSSEYRLIWMDDPWDDVARAGRWLQALAQDIRPDVVHLNDFAHGALAWPAPVLMVAHSCVCSWWQAVHHDAAPAAWNRYRDCVRAGIDGADHLVAPTQAMLNAIVSHYGAPASSQVISNGRSAAVDNAKVVKEPLVLAAGRLWDEAKNLRMLASVAHRLPWPVCIAGNAHHPDGGKVTLGSDDRGREEAEPAGAVRAPSQRAPSQPAHLLGQLSEPDLRRWLAHASIYALPAHYEPFGLSILEAAQAGCALVLGDIPSLREVWGDAALYVPPDNPDMLVFALCRLIDDAALREAMAARARERAQRYTPKAMGLAYRAAYRNLIAQARATGAGARSRTAPAIAGAIA